MNGTGDTKKVNITIRRATTADAHDFAYVICESWKVAYKDIIPPDVLERNTNLQKREEIFSSRMKSEEQCYYIAYDGKIPCGVCSTCPSRDADKNGWGEVVAIYTLLEYWGTGVGNLLMKVALEGLRKQGFTRFLLWVFESNPRARRFYEKCGFFADGTVKEFGHGGAQVVRYIKEILLKYQTAHH